MPRAVPSGLRDRAALRGPAVVARLADGLQIRETARVGHRKQLGMLVCSAALARAPEAFPAVSHRRFENHFGTVPPGRRPARSPRGVPKCFSQSPRETRWNASERGPRPPPGPERSKTSLGARMGNRMERLTVSRKCGRADERSKLLPTPERNGFPDQPPSHPASGARRLRWRFGSRSTGAPGLAQAAGQCPVNEPERRPRPPRADPWRNSTSTSCPSGSGDMTEQSRPALTMRSRAGLLLGRGSTRRVTQCPCCEARRLASCPGG